MANKLARIAWAVLSSGNDYRSAAVPASPARKGRLRLGSAVALPLSRTTTTTRKASAPRSAQGDKDERTVTTACPQPGTENGLHDRATYKDRHARISSWPGELVSIKRPNTFAQTCLLDQTSPCSRAADHPLPLQTDFQVRSFPQSARRAKSIIALRSFRLAPA